MSVKIEDVVCEAETDKAILVSIEAEDFWIPKSHIEDDSEVYEKGNEGTLVISDWIAKKNSLGDQL